MRMQRYEQIFSSSFAMTFLVVILVFIAWSGPYPIDIGGKNYMLMLKSSVNSARIPRE